MQHSSPSAFRAALLAAAIAASLALSGCESLGIGSITKKIDYKSQGRAAPALEVPPDLTQPQFDERYNVATAAGAAAARNAGRVQDIAPNATADARIVRAGTERWIVARMTPEQAFNVVRAFWTETGFVIAQEQPLIGVLETDWAENRAEIPQDFIRRSLGKVADVLYTTYKRDKFRTRIERGAEPGTVEIYLSHRGMEQMPTALSQGVPVAFAWAVLPPNPDLEAEMLTRMMVRLGTPETQAQQALQSATAQPERARLQKTTDGVNQLLVDDAFDRAWRRVGLTLDRIGFTVVDRDRSKGVYFVRYSDPDAEVKKDGFFSRFAFWRDKSEKPEEYRIAVEDTAPSSTVSVQSPDGKPDRSANSEKILALLRDQLK